MKLVVDIGNTKVKAGVFDGKRLVEVRAYDAWRRDDLESLRQAYAIDGGILATVSDTPDWVAAAMADVPFLIWDRFQAGWRFPVHTAYD
ncbi:MAG: hypothetical protein K2O46_07690, partial [Bacteroidales bacterium]|nr:hypothetical protein [Bacteroidales bacterium]MDE7104113.1 hypothetical protein [Bacteroidales bacterium]